MAALTNEQFAERIGCHFTMASRLRNGHRLPSVATMIKISKEFEIPIRTLAEAYDLGADAFGELLRTQVFKIRPTELVA